MTAFCIPNAHYQWKVMSFGLKVAPSLFQKGMIKMFEPILHHTLVYIDDVLLFSKDHDSHQQLLSHFLEIVETHGIMLSDKKSILGQNIVTFLGMTLKDGYYSPGPHIAQELIHFPNKHLSKNKFNSSLVLSITFGNSFHMWQFILVSFKKCSENQPPMGPFSDCCHPTPQKHCPASSSFENPH